MITHVTQTDFIDTFKQSHSYKTNFSYDGLIALFDYFESIEINEDLNYKFDMIGICCDYSEYKNIDQFIIDYQDSPELHENLNHDEIMSVLRDHTEVIEFDGSTTKVFVGDQAKPDKSFIILAF
jgi:hypothetical protein